MKLHFACCEIKEAKLKLENGKEWTGLKFSVDKKWKTATVNFTEKLQPQKATLSLKYDGKITTGLNGFYRSTYKTKDGVIKVMAATQFEVGFAFHNSHGQV